MQSDFLLSTDQNIQKQYINIPQTVIVPNDFSYHDFSIPHNLGYIPSARVWYEPEPNKWYPLALTQMSDGTSTRLATAGVYSLTPSSVIVSLTNSTITNQSVNIWVRVYLDD